MLLTMLFIALLVAGLNLHPNWLGWLMLGLLVSIVLNKDLRAALTELEVAIREARKGPIWHR